MMDPRKCMSRLDYSTTVSVQCKKKKLCYPQRHPKLAHLFSKTKDNLQRIFMELEVH